MIQVEMEVKTYEAYKELEKRAKTGSKKSFHYRLYNSIQKAIEKLKKDPASGETVSYKD